MPTKIQSADQRKSRRTTEAGYARGSETRLRIIQVAIVEFGEVGFRRTSMRTVAAKARVNAPVLHYYFEGKRGLYSACIEHVHKCALELSLGMHAQAQSHITRNLSRPDLIEIVCDVYDRAADYILRTPERALWFKFFTCDSVDQSLRQERLRAQQNLENESRRLMRDVIGQITGKGSGDLDTHLRVLTLGGQLAVFALAPEYCRNQLGAAVDDASLQMLKVIIRQQTEAALRSALSQ